MTNIIDIINEINKDNSSNYKINVLKKYKDNKLLQKVLKMTYDKVTYTYGITNKNITFNPGVNIQYNLSQALDILDNFVTRTWTGNRAITELENLYKSLQKDEALIIKSIIDRDLRINMGRSNINKVFKNLIVKPPYMRCGIYTTKTARKINFPALVQIKADGRYTSVEVDKGNVKFISRSGEEKEFPLLEEKFKNFPCGIYIGELLLKGESNRALSNGNINSDSPDHENIYIQLWDFITWDEWSRPKDKENKTIYKDRIKNLETNIVQDSFVEIITTYDVSSKKDALKHVSNWMQEGFEGGILKDYNNIFIDHTSPTQLKLKLEIDADVRVTGFTEGKKGTKREQTFGALTFENDEGNIKGQTSGFTDDMLEEINNNREKYIGKIITVQFNDITKSKNNDYYALSHPRFIAFRDDKQTTDTLERILEMKEMAMGLKE